VGVVGPGVGCQGGVRASEGHQGPSSDRGRAMRSCHAVVQLDCAGPVRRMGKMERPPVDERKMKPHSIGGDKREMLTESFLTRSLGRWEAVAERARADGDEGSLEVAVRRCAELRLALPQRARFRLTKTAMEYALDELSDAAGLWATGFDAKLHAGKTYLDLTHEESSALAEAFAGAEDYWATAQAATAGTPAQGAFAARSVGRMVAVAIEALSWSNHRAVR